MARGKRTTTLAAPFLKRLSIHPDAPLDRSAYPFGLPMFRDPDFEIVFDRPVTVIVGENGSGKSTLLEAIAALVGFDEAGGGPGYRPVDHSTAMARSGADLRTSLRASWLPRVGTGWFFRAETFFSVARYLDDAARNADAVGPDFLSHSHGEGFLSFFEERCGRQGVYIFDEPESALSPARQFEFVKLLDRMNREARAQAIVATHAPIIMASPGARLLQVTAHGLQPIALEDTDHFRMLQAFFADPRGTVEAMLD